MTSKPDAARAISDLSDFNKLQEFVRDASPASWLEYAEEIRDSAELIWAHQDDGFRISATLNQEDHLLDGTGRISSVSRTYMLLAGFALENVMKGHLVFRDPSHVNQGHLSQELKLHDVVGLAMKIPGLQLSENEHKFCANASQAIPYWGRYPIPLKKSQLLPEIGVDEALRGAFLELFERLASGLYWAVRDGWDSGVGPKTIKIRNARYSDTFDPTESLF